MKIARFAESASPVLGGYPGNEYLVCRGLAGLGHDVTLFTSNAPPSRYFLDKQDMNQEQDASESFRVIRTDAALTLGGDAPLMPFLLRKAWRLGAEIVHAHEAYQPSSLMAWFLSLKNQAAFTFSQERYYTAKRRAWRVPMWMVDKTLVPLTYRSAKMATAFSSAAAAYLSEQGYPRERVKIMPMCMDPSKFQVPGTPWLRRKLGLGKKEPLVLSVARLHKSKGLVHLLEAMLKVTRAVRDVKLAIVGRGREEWNLRSYASDLGLGKSVFFLTDFIQHSELASCYHEADVFALPSLYETFGVSVIEAMAAGKPVVVSDVGGMRDTVINFETGFRVRPGDADGLARALLRLLNDSGPRESMGRQARKAALKYDWHVVARMYQTFYEELVSMN